MQSTVLKELALWNEQINNAQQDIGELKRHLSLSDEAFIVLDDVDHIEQLDALFSPVKDEINSGSLILVTSCNKDLIAMLGIIESFN